jgi:hypothetical protein
VLVIAKGYTILDNAREVQLLKVNVRVAWWRGGGS